MRVLARQAPRSGGSASSTTGRLPTDIQADQVRRLGIFATVAGALWTYGLLMDTLVGPHVLGRPRSSRAIVVELLCIAASAAMCLCVRYLRHSPRVTTDLSLAYLVVNAFGVAMINTWVLTPAIPAGFLSWNTAAVLIFSMIAPATSRKILITSLVAASMDPLGVWLAHLRGVAVPSAAATMILFLPNYLCAVVAVIPAHIVHRLGRRLKEAEELGSYQLVELLGQGGMGEVWRADHRLLARSAAIKLVRPELLGAVTSDEAQLMLRRFEREARATAVLSSPHTIQIFDYGITDEGVFYYVMELLTGRDLEAVVRQFGPLPASRVMFLLRQACHSLADAHARGLVHRDIKPANIYLCRMGREYDFVKVLDFGLVKLQQRISPEQTLLTARHGTTGTPAYMAPELILGGGEVDRRADVYAIGCVAYFLLTGQLVFEADTSMKMLMQHVHARPVPPSQRTELVIPREMDELVLACLEKDPNDRPQSAEELFDLACDCRVDSAWTPRDAADWWRRHLPELSTPLAAIDVPSAATEPTTAIL